MFVKERRRLWSNFDGSPDACPLFVAEGVNVTLALRLGQESACILCRLGRLLSVEGKDFRQRQHEKLHGSLTHDVLGQEVP